MNSQILIKVLSIIYLNKVTLIPKRILVPTSGFARLRKQGYITIKKTEGKFYASISVKGYQFLFKDKLDHIISIEDLKR